MDGVMVHRIFKAKPVYVRPVHQIVNPGFLPPLHNVTEVLYAHPVEQLDTSNPGTKKNGLIINRSKHK